MYIPCTLGAHVSGTTGNKTLGKMKKLGIKKFENCWQPKNPREFLCRPVMESYGFMVIVLVAFVVVGSRIESLSSRIIIDY